MFISIQRKLHEKSGFDGKIDGHYGRKLSPITRSPNTMLNYCEIERICTEFVNDGDTTSGMENNWHDFLVEYVPLDYTRQEIMEALNVETTVPPVPITVKHENYGEMDVYVAIQDQNITISTKEWLL